MTTLSRQLASRTPTRAQPYTGETALQSPPSLASLGLQGPYKCVDSSCVESVFLPLSTHLVIPPHLSPGKLALQCPQTQPTSRQLQGKGNPNMSQVHIDKSLFYLMCAVARGETLPATHGKLTEPGAGTLGGPSLSHLVRRVPRRTSHS